MVIAKNSLPSAGALFQVPNPADERRTWFFREPRAAGGGDEFD